MNTNTVRARRSLRLTVATVSALGLTAVLQAPATARPDAGDPLQSEISPVASSPCSLERLGRQLVRCDDLTGAGVAAPLTVPEQ